MTRTLTVQVPNAAGMHARPSAEFVKLAGSFASSIQVSRNDLEVNAKSIMGVLMLAAEQGSELTIAAEGADADRAVEALARLVRRGFDE